MASIKDSITRALKMIGAIAATETPSADEIADGLTIFNAMMGQWSTQSLAVYSKTRESFALIPSQQTYTIGSGGDFDTVRPLKIENASIEIESSSPISELPLLIVNQDQWQNVQVKATTSTIPQYLYPDFQYPLANLNVWPIPSAANNLVLYSWKQLLATVSDANTTLDLPPGYDEAVHYNLAIRFAPEWGKQLDPRVDMRAQESFANIKRMNIKPIYLDVDQALMSEQRPFNWLRGD